MREKRQGQVEQMLEEALKLQSRLAAMTALAKEMQKRLCKELCIVVHDPEIHQQSPECLSFQQRIKEIEEQG